MATVKNAVAKKSEKVQKASAPVVKKDEKAAAPAAEGNGKSLEGLTKKTIETGVIHFNENSGSQDMLNLIAKHGFDKEKVVSEAEKLRKAGKGFQKSEPAKKYIKISGIVRKLTDAGYKLPKVEKVTA